MAPILQASSATIHIWYDECSDSTDSEYVHGERDEVDSIKQAILDSEVAERLREQSQAEPQPEIAYTPQLNHRRPDQKASSFG